MGIQASLASSAEVCLLHQLMAKVTVCPVAQKP